MAAIFTKWFPSGFRLINGLTLSNWFNNPQSSTENTITAHAGGGQASAYQLSALTSRISVCATTADSVKLPRTSQSVGSAYVVINDGAQTLAVFPFATATIDGGAASASVNIGTGKRAIFWCDAVGNWTSGGLSKTT